MQLFHKSRFYKQNKKIPLIFKNQQLYGNRVKQEYDGETVWRCHREVR